MTPNPSKLKEKVWGNIEKILLYFFVGMAPNSGQGVTPGNMGPASVRLTEHSQLIVL